MFHVKHRFYFHASLSSSAARPISPSVSPAKPSTTVDGWGGTAWQYRLRGWTRMDF